LKFPESAVALVDEICRLVPERLPEPGETMEQYQRYAGKRELALQLVHMRDEAKRRAALPEKPRVRR
jgi:hypothetical protein